MSQFKRNPLPEDQARKLSDALQQLLPKLTDLGIAGKQIHWNIVGRQFLSVHEKLDDVVAAARKHADVVAERMVQFGFAPDGRANMVVEHGQLSPSLPTGFMSVQDGLTLICDRLYDVIKANREALDVAGEIDPPTEDYLNDIAQDLEEYLWMLQAMEE
jgi:starvation-inducible DNA-binding protein